MKKIGILTSGGDAPGMNAAIRAIVRSSLNKKFNVIGFKNGYDGLIDNKFVNFDRRSVGNIIQHGGSILYTSRSLRFLEEKYRLIAAKNLDKIDIDSLVVIGGEGSARGAKELAKDTKIKVVCIPATIDKDMPLVGKTIGFDTAINTALNAIDKIRDTATTSNVTHIVEVMGRNCGWLAILAGIGAGAEAALIPESKTDVDILSKRVINQLKSGKKGCILIVAEGSHLNGNVLAEKLKEKRILDIRITSLGHIQRGGNPSAADRVLASELGYAAVKSVINNTNNVILAKPLDKIKEIPLNKLKTTPNKIDKSLYNLINILA